MRFAVDIEYPEEKMFQNYIRWATWKRYGYHDRVRVEAGFETRNMLAARGISWIDYMDNVEDHYYHQLLNHKWRIENVPDDFCFSPEINVLPDTQNCVAAAFGADITLYDQDAPFVHGNIRTPEDVERMEVPKPTEGYWGHVLDWYQKMVELSEQTKLTFNGKPGRIRVGVKEISDPFTICSDLIGPEAYMWVYDYPETVELLLDKIVAGYLGWMKHARKITNNPGRVMYSGGDGGSLLSEKHYRRFILPRYLQIWSIHPGERFFHMCGQMEHLLSVIRDSYKIDEFYGFGYQVPAETIASELGGYCRLLGNLDPVLIYNGPVESIRNQSLERIVTFAKYGGYCLCDGYNVPPGTPLHHIQAIVDAAEEYGKPEITAGPIAVGQRIVDPNPPLERAFH
jgi:uroporphyrinogen-III decarboxylase